MRSTSPASSSRTIIITAGPTHEPIDRVRFLGNRSSGRVGAALADEAAARGWNVTLLLGPCPATTRDSRAVVHRFRTAADLQQLLRAHVANADVLVMAAAVADYRPVIDPTKLDGKFRRSSQPLELRLEATPDLLAEVAAARRPGQFLVGFALEPRDEMIESATSKLNRKHIDLVIANPLETMDSDVIEAAAVDASGVTRRTDGAIPKTVFAGWLLQLIEERTGVSGAKAP